MNRQIGVGDSKNVIVFDPLLTNHVIRRMRRGRGRIFNGNQWELVLGLGLGLGLGKIRGYTPYERKH